MCSNNNQPVPIQKEVKPLLRTSDISETCGHTKTLQKASVLEESSQRSAVYYAIHIKSHVYYA